MITKLPTELVPGDRLATYDLRGRKLDPVPVVSPPDIVHSIMMTAHGALRINPDIPVEIEP